MPTARLQGNWMRDGGRQRERATERATERERETERERVQCCVMWRCCRVGLALGHVSLVINMRCGATWQKANAKAISFRTQTLQGVHFTCPPTTTQSELHLAREWVGESERQKEIEKKRERDWEQWDDSTRYWLVRSERRGNVKISQFPRRCDLGQCKLTHHCGPFMHSREGWQAQLNQFELGGKNYCAVGGNLSAFWRNWTKNISVENKVLRNE